VVVVEKLESQIVSALQNSGKPLTLSEIALQVGIPEKKVYKSLRKLFEKGKIDCNNRRYRLTEE
jgi:DNA-binding IclR family transcriptional regulator